MQKFLVTGGYYSETTEILEDKKWTVLKNGNLPFKIRGLLLETVENKVFSFGNIQAILSSPSPSPHHPPVPTTLQKRNFNLGWHYNNKVLTHFFKVGIVLCLDLKLNPSLQSSNSILMKGDGTINLITWADQDTISAYLLLTSSTTPRRVLANCKLFPLSQYTVWNLLKIVNINQLVISYNQLVVGYNQLLWEHNFLVVWCT